MAPEVSLEALMDYEVEACLATVSAPQRESALDDFSSRKDQGRSRGGRPRGPRNRD